MKNRITKLGLSILLLLAAQVTLPTAVHAEMDVGNGGGGWVCREGEYKSGQIRWAELVDLFEAKSEFGISIAQYPGSMRDIVDQVALRLFKADKDLYEDLLASFDKVAYLEPNPPQTTYTEDELRVVDDSLYRLIPSAKKCLGGTIRYEQIVNYKDDGLVLVQSEVFNSLTESSKAALVFHEVIYLYRRQVSGDPNSTITRRMVGLIFSTLSTSDLKKSLDDLGFAGMNAIGMKFVVIRAGTFQMGSPSTESYRDSDEILHTVTLTHDFQMQATEVTQAQWFKVMGNNPSNYKKYEDCPSDHVDKNGVSLCPNLPVETVSWNDAQAFIGRLNETGAGYTYSLPTEAQWEYAARGGRQTAYSFGDNVRGELDSYGWYSENSGGRTHTVATKKANPFGLYDMHGNVWEWVKDWYTADLGSNLQIDPVGPDSGSRRVVRGGGWNSNAQYLRSAYRRHDWPSYSFSYLGLRLVRTPR